MKCTSNTVSFIIQTNFFNTQLKIIGEISRTNRRWRRRQTNGGGLKKDPELDMMLS